MLGQRYGDHAIRGFELSQLSSYIGLTIKIISNIINDDKYYSIVTCASFSIPVKKKSYLNYNTVYHKNIPILFNLLCLIFGGKKL